MDMYRALCSPKFFIGFLGLCLSLFLGFIDLNGGHDVLYIFYSLIHSITSIVLFIFCAFTYADSFCDDFENKHFMYSVARGNTNKYILSKVLVITLTSVLTMVLGVLLLVIILRCFYPWYESTYSVYETLVRAGKYPTLLANKKFILYYLVLAIQMGMYAAILSLIATYFSLFVSNKLLILTIPSVAFYFLSYIFPKENRTLLNDIFMSPILHLKSTKINLLVILCITIFSIAVLYIAIARKVNRRIQNE